MIRHGSLKDKSDVLKIYEEARAFIKTYNSPQWQTGEPNEQSFLRDLKDNSLYVKEVDGEVVAVCTILFYEPTYEKIDGTWLNNEKSAVIHRIATKTSKRGKGYAKDFLDFINQNLKYNSIKIDTHELNEPMKNFLIKNDFKYCGIIYLNQEHDNKRLAYQKIFK